jgi:ubiquinone/menaquinone biosynthesis C-methylase UbiE
MEVVLMITVEDAVSVFDKNAKEYDEWFEKHPAVFESELNALRSHVPRGETGIEVGVGTGRFAKALGIQFGVEPAAAMRDISSSRGINVVEGVAEKLPFSDESFDFVLFVTTLCFVRDPLQALKEARRILKPEGVVIVGIIDKNSPLGMRYEKSETNAYYRFARFIAASELEDWLTQVGFKYLRSSQTLLTDPEKLQKPESAKSGYGEGGFVVISGTK